jgi:5'-nucleotidase
MAMRSILADKRPDLILSGVNRGQNVAEDVSYSGTIAAAIEGTMLGVRSIALSQAYGPGGRNKVKFQTAEAHGPGVIQKLLTLELPKNSLVNVNFPDCEPDEIVGVVATNQGLRNQEFLRIDERQDGRGNPYYWIAFAKADFTPGHGTDLWAIASRRISVTPLKLDLTDEPTLTQFAQVFR